MPLMRVAALRAARRRRARQCIAQDGLRRAPDDCRLHDRRAFAVRIARTGPVRRFRRARLFPRLLQTRLMDPAEPGTPSGVEPQPPLRPTGAQRFKRILLGSPKDLQDPHLFPHLSLAAFLASLGLGGDGPSASAYGPQEPLKNLGEHTD